MNIEITSADSYNTPNKNKGMNVNSTALFIKFGDNDWELIKNTKSLAKAQSLIRKVLGVLNEN